MRYNPDLYVVPSSGGRPRLVSRHRGMNTGASWSPDGSKLAVTLSRDGQPDIYVINARDGKILRRLTNNRSIDSGAAWSPNGNEIAFVSDREGGPQIFVMNADGSNQRRVSMNGNYNTTPSWNPRKGTRQLAYTTRADRTFDIVTLDLASGKMVRITQNEGVNEEPSWAPNGRAIAFASHRPGGTGIWIAGVDGKGDAVMVLKGWTTSIDWGPVPRQ
jgi:TolB protein